MDGDLKLRGATAIGSATVDGTAHLYVAGSLDDGVSVFRIDGDETLTSTANVHDIGLLALDNAMDAAAAQVGARIFVVAGEDDHGLSVFGLHADGTVTTAFARVGGTDLLIAVGYDDNGLGAFEIGGGDDTLVGTAGFDLLLGLGGDDRLDGGDGVDVVAFTGPVAAYGVVQHQDGSDTVTDLRGGSPEGTDELVSIERLRFADVVLNPDGTPAENQPPTDITVQGGTAVENAAARTLVATLGALDPDSGESFSFGLEDPSGSFVVSGDGIHVAPGDRIEDFGRGDRIVVRAIDAVTRERGDQNFRLDHDGAFEAGEIRVPGVKAGAIVEFNADRDARAEMTILLAGSHGHLNDSGFVL